MRVSAWQQGVDTRAVPTQESPMQPRVYLEQESMPEQTIGSGPCSGTVDD